MRNVTNRLIWLISREWTQPFWQFIWRLSLAGMNYTNDDEQLNGEHAFLVQVLKEKAEPVLFDIGANKGEFCADAIRINPNVEVHAFEPNPPTFQRLSSRMQGEKKVSLSNVGVGEKEEMLEIFDHDNDQGTEQASFIKETFEDLYRGSHRTTRVPVIRIDDYVDQHAINRIDLLKIDVEGFERAVLAGAQKTLMAGKVTHVLLEFNAHHIFADSSVWKIAKLLEGFDVFRLLPHGMEPVVTRDVPYNSRVEIFKYCNLVALRRE